MNIFTELFSRRFSIMEKCHKAINIYVKGGIKKNIFFLHIPKTAGTSFTHSFQLHLRPYINLNPDASFDVIKIINNTNYPYDTDTDYPILALREKLLLYFMSQNRFQLVSGHFPFSEAAYREFHSEYAWLTILRNPTERWISNFFYNKYKESDHCKIKEDIFSFLDSRMGRSQGHEMVKFIGGPLTDNNYSEQTAIDRAKTNLHKFDIVGFLEYPEHFKDIFLAQFGIKLNLKKKNPNPKSKSFQRSVITEDLLSQINELCRPDLELYHYAVDNFIKNVQ